MQMTWLSLASLESQNLEQMSPVDELQIYIPVSSP